MLKFTESVRQLTARAKVGAQGARSLEADGKRKRPGGRKEQRGKTFQLSKAWENEYHRPE